MQIKKVLLIGGSGFVGGWIANCLSERGIRVTIPSRHRDHSKKVLLLPTVYVVQADAHDPKTLASLMHGMDAVINLVGILHDSDASRPHGKRFTAAHVELPQKIVAAMRQAGVRRLVHMSALKADVNAPSAYLRSKGAGEAAVRAAMDELDVTIFRPSVIFGPDDAFLNTFATLLKFVPVFPLGTPNARFQPVYVGDVANAFVDCLDDSATFGQTYELCGPKQYTLRQLVEYVGTLTDHRRPVICLPAGMARLQAKLLGLLPNPPMSPDNLLSMQVDNVTDGTHDYPGWQPHPLESIAPGYLTPIKFRRRLAAYRSHAGR